MIGRTPPILALVILERRLLVAEMAGRHATQPRLAETFDLPEGITLDQPSEAGLALQVFLKQRGFAARDAVVGIPGRWVLAQEHAVPPAGTAQVAALLRIQAEKMAVSDSADMAFDYAGESRSDGPTRVLLVATLKKRMDQIDQFAAAAGLRVRSVTPTVLAAAQVVGADAADAPMLLLSQTSADVLWRTGGKPRLMQHVPTSLNGHGRTLELLGIELRRGLALNADGTDAGQRGAIILDTTGLHFNEMRALSNDSGLSFEAPKGSEAMSKSPQAPAAFLAMAASHGTLAIDFKHSRLASAPRRRFGRRAAWAAALTLLALIALFVEVTDYRAQRWELTALQEQADRVAPEIAGAEASLDRIAYGREYFEDRPSALACLRELTLAFDPRDPVWTTVFTFRENRHGQFNGATTEQRAVLALLERLKANPNFSNVTLVDLRQAAAARDRQVTFAISFVFQAKEAG